jgi:hypothetical protein
MDQNTQPTEKIIESALDSVNLINKLINSDDSTDKKSHIERNVKHLELMMTKDSFSKALTKTQKSSIKSAITKGNSFIA